MKTKKILLFSMEETFQPYRLELKTPVEEAYFNNALYSVEDFVRAVDTATDASYIFNCIEDCEMILAKCRDKGIYTEE